MGCLLDANLGPTWRPRRLQDEPEAEAEKKATKKDEKSRFILRAAQSSKMTPKITLQTWIFQDFGLNFEGFSEPIWEDFHGV